MRDALGNPVLPGAMPVNPSPLAAQRLQQLAATQALARPVAQPALNPTVRQPVLRQPVVNAVRPILPTNASPLAAQRLAMLGQQGRPPAPVQMAMPPNPALQAQRTAMPRGFGTIIR